MDALPFFHRSVVAFRALLERFPTNKVTVLSQHVVVGEALIDQRVLLAFGHRLPHLLVKVSKADVLHDFSCSYLPAVNSRGMSEPTSDFFSLSQQIIAGG
jgi:hypothetical protein